jgi:uncharacterized damage-inducible protein DinB
MVSDFSEVWDVECRNTSVLFSKITDSSLNQKVYHEGRSLGFLEWHIIVSIGEMAERIGLKLDCPALDSPIPNSANEIYFTFKKVGQSLAEEVKKFSDEDLAVKVDMYGEMWSRGRGLDAIIKHLAHHRGQLTVLMRQAGLKVHGVYGPAKEEWTAFGVPPHP